MTDSTHGLFHEPKAVEPVQTVSLGASLVAVLIVVALVLTVVKLLSEPQEPRSSLIPLDQPAAWSGFTA
ncbi:hypothetical protein [Dongia mobilis]|jgi:hypothetical protein|uniref:hypothetical protein n=1 Tax=Dongia sp. TaxID=1977262 RepID=UPI0026F02B08